jgi:hypothetical protein
VLPDHFCRLEEERRRDCQADGVGCLEIDNQVELCRSLHRYLGWIGAPEDFVDVDGTAPQEDS